jgi:hypothetical protein
MRSADGDVTGTHYRTDIMGIVFGSPWKVLVVATALVVAIVLIALLGSKKLPAATASAALNRNRNRNQSTG